MTEPQDTYAARPKAEKAAARLARKKEQVWRKHCKRQWKHTPNQVPIERYRAFCFLLFNGHTACYLLGFSAEDEKQETIAAREYTRYVNQLSPLP